MRTTLIAVVVALSALLLSPAGQARDLEADTAYYRGGGNGIKVEVRARYQKIVYALIKTTWFCTDREGRRSKERLRTFSGNKNLVPPGETRYGSIGPIPVRPAGRFTLRTHFNDADFLWDARLQGRIGPRRAVGQFRSHVNDKESGKDCQTGGFIIRSGTERREKESLNFRAYRVSKK